MLTSSWLAMRRMMLPSSPSSTDSWSANRARVADSSASRAAATRRAAVDRWMP